LKGDGEARTAVAVRNWRIFHAERQAFVHRRSVGRVGVTINRDREEEDEFFENLGDRVQCLSAAGFKYGPLKMAGERNRCPCAVEVSRISRGLKGGRQTEKGYGNLCQRIAREDKNHKPLSPYSFTHRANSSRNPNTSTSFTQGRLREKNEKVESKDALEAMTVDEKESAIISRK